MENDIWNEISSFLNQLRCENINRESYIYFQELANIQLKKKMEKEKVNKLLDHISYEDREKLKQYWRNFGRRSVCVRIKGHIVKDM